MPRNVSVRVVRGDGEMDEVWGGGGSIVPVISSHMTGDTELCVYEAPSERLSVRRIPAHEKRTRERKKKPARTARHETRPTI